MTIFLLGGSFVESTVCNMLDYLLDIHVDNFILIKENHSYEERLLRNHEKIILCETIEECIKKSELVVTIKSVYISNAVLMKVMSLCTKYMKPCVELEYSPNPKNELNDFLSTQNIAEIPTIFNISIGNYAPCIQTEILITKMLLEMNWSIHCNLSPTTINLFKQSAIYSSLSNAIESIGKKHYDVLVVTRQFETIRDMITDFSLIQFFYNFPPECLLLNIDSGFRDFDTLENICKYRLNKEIDQYIISDYTGTSSLTQDLRPLYYECYDRGEKYIFANNSDFINRLHSQIFSKIALPQDIHIV